MEEVPVIGPLCSGTRAKQAEGEVWGSQGLGSSQQWGRGRTCVRTLLLCSWETCSFLSLLLRRKPAQ